MPRNTKPANVELDAKSRCTTVLDNGTRCPEPRIRLNALKCVEHEKVYRAAAKVRAAARKSAALAAANAATKSPRKPRVAKSPATAVANVAVDGKRTTRPAQRMAADAAIGTPAHAALIATND